MDIGEGLANEPDGGKSENKIADGAASSSTRAGSPRAQDCHRAGRDQRPSVFIKLPIGPALSQRSGRFQGMVLTRLGSSSSVVAQPVNTALGATQNNARRMMRLNLDAMAKSRLSGRPGK
jgi:hypothetical protein